MAYPSSSAWKTTTPTKTWSDSASPLSCYFNSTLFSSSSSTIYYPPRRKKKYCITILSFDPSSSSSSWVSSLSFHRTTFTPAPAYKPARTNDTTVSFYHHDESITFEKKNQISPKPIARPLWRKILFASRKMRSIILLNVITVVYASNIPVVKEVEAIMDPAAFSAVRFVVSAIPFLPFVFRARDDVQTRNAGIELGLWVSLGYLIEALGLITSDAGRASFLSLFTVIVIPLLDGMLGAIVTCRTWFGVLMSVLGVAMLECSGSPPNVGDLLNFLSAIFFGIHMLRTEQISRSTKKENFLPILGYEVCVVAFLSTIWYLTGGWFDGVQDCDQASWTWAMLWDWIIAFPWAAALYTGVFSTGLCLWVEMAAMHDVSAAEAAIIYGLEPLWGAGFAWFLLGERWGTTGWIGAALVLGLLHGIRASPFPIDSGRVPPFSGTGSGNLAPVPATTFFLISDRRPPSFRLPSTAFSFCFRRHSFAPL